MRQDWNPLESARDLVDFGSKLQQHNTAQDIAASRKLLEEQNRLQREANELEKRRQAQEQEKIRQGQMGQRPTYTPHQSPPPSSGELSRGARSALFEIGNTPDGSRKAQMIREFKNKHGEDNLPDHYKKKGY